MNFSSARKAYRVTAIFYGTKLSFEMSRETTLAQLAEQLYRLGDIHGLPLSVDVRAPVERGG
jgi:hypothetical protein